MKIKRNAISEASKHIVSSWILILVVYIKIQPTFLSHDLQRPADAAKHYDTTLHQLHALHPLQGDSSVDLKFKHPVYNVTIYENSVGKTYAIPVPHEEFMGIVIRPDLKVHFRIISGDRDKLFKAEERIVGNFAFLTIRTRTSNVVLNREKTEEYNLKVRAVIGGGGSSSSQPPPDGMRNGTRSHETETTVHVQVLDRNDLSPLFYPTEYAKTIPEDTPIHKSILRVTAEDADLGINGEIYYSLLLDNDYFSIHPTSGVLMLTRQIKYTENSRFDFVVLANDRGSDIHHYSHQASKAKVSIIIEQVNLHAPDIYVKTLSSIPTNVHTLIYGVVRVSDKDMGRHGEINKLEIIDGDPDGHFLIKRTETEGEFYIELNRFAQQSTTPYTYNLTLRAEDRGVPPRLSYKSVPVHIISQSSNSPIFTKQLYEVSIPETSPPSMPVIRLKVTDPDLGKNALVFLEIVGGNEGGEFRINPDSGMLYTQKMLDAEKKSFYTLTVSAIDQANVGVRKQSSAKVKINIEDMNDNDPVFEPINTTLLINENELAGLFVVKLTAKDRDFGENSYISYSIANLDEVPFEIDHFTGVIRTTVLIDYETMRRKYVLRVRASDWGLPYRRQTECELLIEVKDINDNRPQFERVNCAGKILRSVPVGTDVFTLSAIDFDAKDYITYRLIAGNEDGCFNLDPTTGVLSIGCDLSDVGVANRIINVSSTDGTHFSDEMSIRVQLVTDDAHGLMRNDMMKGYGAFECRETGVARRLAEILAAAEKNNANAGDRVEANNLALKSSRFGDNLHTPEFVDFPLELRLNESIQLGETVAWIKARDRDLGYNGKLVFAISDGDYDSVFRIDPDNGELQIIGYLDRERQDEYNLNITVFDLGRTQKYTSKMLPVTILDSNDNRPVYQKSLVSLRLVESAVNGTIVFCLNASDSDTGKNAEIAYVMQAAAKEFHVDRTNGCLYLIDALDREKEDRYELHVIAKDGGQPALSAEAVINVIVEDINDNAPTFGVQEYIFKVREDIPRGSVVASIEASDFDSGINAEIHFSLKEDALDNGLFKIDKYTGVIRTQGYLDYETQQVHNLIVSAIDCGTPSLTADMPVVIEIIDVNENRYAPEFDDFVYVGKIKENQPKGSIVMNLTARDLDTNGPDSRISYSIPGGDGLGVFAVNDQGAIRTLSHLDAETKSSYWLTLCAQDHGIVPLSSCVQVYIEIENENDNVPLTDKPVYYQSVPEGSAPNTKVLELNAIDNDNDPTLKITYKIISGNPEGYFAINTTTGELTTTERKLDRENQAEHVLEVSVTDNGIPPLSSTTRIVVAVEDVNDHSPEFDQRFYKIQVPSTVSINESIFQVQAFDNDIGENGRITYYIKSGKGKNKFRMDANTGFIFVSKPLEAETEYDLNIRADDNGTPKRTQSARLNVVVIAISEKSPHPPIIKTTDNNVDVTESDRPGFLVTLIQAMDEDGDHLWYNISGGNDRNEFYIGWDNGNILLAKSLDWETQASYNLTISVTDGTYVVQTQLYVQVVDTNDNRPQFSEDIYYVNISENIEEESVIMQLHATDRDEDKKIFFTLHAVQDPTTLSLFRIDSITGNVLVTQRLDYEKNRHHVLIVIAKDQGTPAKRNYAKIIITVHDHNDHYPEFTSKIIQSKIPESAAVGSKVVQLYALDQDCGKNAEVKYSIVTGNVGNMFNIDAALGVVTLGESLNINQMQEYMLQVKATDRGEPPLSSQVPLHIIVTMSENDPPKYFAAESTHEIYENLAKGTFVTQVEARSSSSVFYELIAGNDGECFHINPSTGVITTNARIDYETNKSFNITVRGTNMASASSDHNVIIHILDFNDNAPEFGENKYFGEISEAAEIGSFVYRNDSFGNSPLLIKMFDLDVGINGMVECNIMDEMVKHYFKIDSPTGAIKLIQPLDYESIKMFKFRIMANDLGTPKLYSKAMADVEIAVRNVNDCPPVFAQKEYNVSLYVPTFDNVIVAQVNASDADMDEKAKIRYDIVDGNANNCFDIESSTGIITTRNVELLRSFHSLHVRASDGLYSTITHVNIAVKKSDTSGSFVFQKARYEFNTVENSTKIVIIGLVNVLGNLLHENVEYRILNPTELFQIGKTSGAIKTTGRIFDRETEDNYRLIIEAKSLLYDNNNRYVRRAHVMVEVTVLDVNDNCPMFVNLPYFATISVDDAPGTVIAKVKAVDLDSYENGEVRYEMKKGNGEFFKVDRKTGELTLRQAIEDHNRNYDLLIAAYDGAITPCSTDVLVQIKVVDKSMPIFDKQFYSDVLNEDVEVFSVLSVSIHAESPLKRKLIYTISKGNDEELFEIDYRNGVLYVVNKLDYEAKQSHDLVIRATDGISGIFAEVSVSINVVDANDCYPAIEQENYNITLSENLLIGTQILKINASDRDTNANSELSYFIESVNGRNDSELFYIDMAEGAIYLKNALDYEQYQMLHLIVAVKDHGLPTLASKTNVWIRVKDLNDNSPRFVEPSFLSKLSVLAVRGQFVTITKAYDLDYSDNDRLAYKIIDGNDLQTYAIDERTGIITLHNMHNFTDKPQTVLNVSVTDGVHTIYTRVKILLLPENVHSPVFLKAVYEAAIKENDLPGISVVNVQARDKDFGKYAKLIYEIVSEEMKQYFEIDKTSGAVHAKVVFDREKRDNYDLLVKATDGGGKLDFTMIKVRIDDENDNQPYFNCKEYKTIAKHNAPANTTVLKVKAMDFDVAENADIRYRIEPPLLNTNYSGFFAINESDGVIRILRSAEQLEHQVVQFFVRASDNGTPPLHIDVPVSISFINGAVETPQFEKAVINLHVIESTPPGSILTKLHVTGNFSVRFSLATDTTKFFVAENGEILLMQTLDREAEEMHYFVAMSATTTLPTLYAYVEVHVHVQDENDNYPRFDSGVYAVEIAENLAKMSSIVKVTAVDTDAGSNGDVRYYLEDETHAAANVFEIDIYSGWITLLTTLDREHLATYNFNVMAADNGQPKHVSKVAVAIKLKDYNDNPALFKQPQSQQIDVNENALPGTVLGQFAVSDADADAEKSDVDYFLVGGDNHAQFQIGKTGELFVARPLDRERLPAYNLTLLASDGRYTATANVSIAVTDINDNIPYCLRPRYTLTINESIPLGSTIARIAAIDVDERGNEHLRYYLTGNHSDHFHIEKESGLLKVAKPIDREAQPSYTLTAHAQDGQELLWECVSEVLIEVQDLNDNAPEFSMTQYIVSIPEDAQLHTLVTKVHATDRDFGLNRKISYAFVDAATDQAPHFNICTATGIVKLIRNLDRENIASFNLTVRATDHGEPTLVSIAQLVINVLDINDNPPEFSQKQYVAYVPENVSVNAEVGRVFATSKDIGLNAEIRYYLIGGNEQQKFHIDAETGVVYVGGELDYEKTRTYFLSVQAIDGGTPPLSKVAAFNVSVQDVNDNQPKFAQNIYRARVREDIAVGEQIAQVVASDDDSRENGIVAYNIESGDRLGQFAIDALGGGIRVADALDREFIANYLLEVRACDHGQPPLCNYVHVDVQLLDANDNAPLFAQLNYSVVLQENKPLGHVVLRLDVSDADEPPNTAPYTFDFRSGNEARAFRIEQDGTLRTAARFSHQVRDLYTLQVRVFDNGTPPLYSDAWLHVRIIEESQYPPTITPLEITVNSYEDDFSGGFLGRVYASDQDKYDTLQYGLAPTVGEIYVTKHLFNVSHNNGSLYAISNLDTGLYRVNVTATDGKYTTHAIVRVSVELITAEMAANAVVINFNNVSPEEFILSHRKGFIRAIRAIMRCRQKDVVIITLQSSQSAVASAVQSALRNATHAVQRRETSALERGHGRQRKSDINLDVMFAVKKQQIVPDADGYYTRKELYTAVAASFEEIEDGTNLVVEELVAATCALDSCVHGECVSRIALNKNRIATFFTDVISVLTPHYSQLSECVCRPGYDGADCDEPVNACASDPCPPPRYCTPAVTTSAVTITGAPSNALHPGYQCVCPRGYSGPFCEQKTSSASSSSASTAGVDGGGGGSDRASCENGSCMVNTFTAVSFSGKSYAHYKINKAVAQSTLESQFVCSLKVRTVQQTGTIFYASGRVDYNILEVQNGAVQYRFDLGSGEGIVGVSSVYVADGEWHTITLERVLNSAKLAVDGKHVSQGSSPGVNEILNIQSHDVFVGAQVKPHPSIIGFEHIQRGFIGCMADIRFSHQPLPLYISGGSSIAALKRFTNVEFTCDAASVLIHLSVCGAQPCLNGGVCSDMGGSQFRCACHARFTGDTCELDLDPCASAPCLYGGRCEHQGAGNYTCVCPLKLSGRRCEYGQFCTPNPCQNGGICEEGDGVPHCMCRGFTGPICELDVNECDNQPCGNGATCINEAGSFRCICPSYLTGASCGDPLYSNSISTRLKNFSVEHITGIISGATIVMVVIIIALCCIIIRRSSSGGGNGGGGQRSGRSGSSYKEANLNSLIEKEKNNKHNAKMSNLEGNCRPMSYAPASADNMFPHNATFVNNLDILRSYGSAGEELENVPFEYQKLNRTNHQQVNINASSHLAETDAVGAAAHHKQDWGEQMHLKTFSENKLNNDKRLEYVAYLKPTCGKLIQVAVPNICHATHPDENSSLFHGQYHWDCSDWVRKSHNPLPDITEVPGAEIADSSSFHSNDSNESKPKTSFMVKNIGEVDSSRDITTLNEDLTSEYVDSELETCMKPFQLPKSISLSRLSSLNKSDNEDYISNTGKVYLRHPDSYLPPLNTPSETEGESSANEAFSRTNNQNILPNRKLSENSEQVYVFRDMICNDGSNSDVHLCEIEDSELEEFIPVKSGNYECSCHNINS